jgi:probable selenium-dependent hydroxylase accessory protein YqeC
VFSEHFAFSLPARINVVGGGGKTGLILELLTEYSHSIPVIFTTTTRIHPPHLVDGTVILSSDSEDMLKLLLDRAVACQCRERKFVVTRLPGAPDLLRGVDPGFADRLDAHAFPMILNEADGARSMSLKMPRDNEPVLITGAGYMVPVIGLDCLNQPLGPESLFRWEIARDRFNMKLGAILTPELAASLLFHPQGVCKGWRPGMRIIPFVNKVDSEAEDALAESLGRALLRNGNFPVERVVLGSVHRRRAASLSL